MLLFIVNGYRGVDKVGASTSQAPRLVTSQGRRIVVIFGLSSVLQDVQLFALCGVIVGGQLGDISTFYSSSCRSATFNGKFRGIIFVGTGKFMINYSFQASVIGGFALHARQKGNFLRHVTLGRDTMIRYAIGYCGTCLFRCLLPPSYFLCGGCPVKWGVATETLFRGISNVFFVSRGLLPLDGPSQRDPAGYLVGGLKLLFTWSRRSFVG